MGHWTVGQLTSVPVADAPDLVAAPVLESLQSNGLDRQVGVVGIDPDLSDTSINQAAFDLPASSLANCVVVGGKRAGDERIAACVVLASTRADVNGVVRRALDVRKASFLPLEEAVERTGMEYGGITPFGVPGDWRVLVDARAIGDELLVMGSGVRRSKLLLPGSLLGSLDGVEIVEDLGRV